MIHILCKSEKEFVSLQYALFENGYWWPRGRQKIYIPDYKVGWDIERSVIRLNTETKKLLFISRYDKNPDMEAIDYINRMNPIKIFIDEIFKMEGVE